MEDGIFKERQSRELSFRAKNKARKRREKGFLNKAPRWEPEGCLTPQALGGGRGGGAGQGVRRQAAEMRVAGMSSEGGHGRGNSVAGALGKLDPKQALDSMVVQQGGAGTKRPWQGQQEEESSDDEPPDEVCVKSCKKVCSEQILLGLT